MSKKSANGKGLTLRQRLRADAEKQLDRIVDQADAAVGELLRDTPLITADVMHLSSSKQTKSLRSHMVSALANAKERELERLYNNQIDMLQEDK